MRKTILVVTAAVLTIVAWRFFQPSQEAVDGANINASALADVFVPADLSSGAVAGKQLFDANCASCHGANAAGQADVAPPLVHIIYEPSHHGDESFQLAVARGVRAHHWPFGNMPAVDGLGRDEVAKIIAYVRELQRANGIN